MTELFAAEIEREAAATRRALERIPDNKGDWKPHEKSMSLSQLATLCATMPGWAAMMVTQDEMDFMPPGGPSYKPQNLQTSLELVEALDRSTAKAREALAATTDGELLRTWRFLVAGKVTSETPKHIVIRDGVLNHLAHHRGQLTVYLRLLGIPVPAIYGPSADEGRFEAK